MKRLFRQPSAWIPLAMSCAALTLLLGHVAVFGIVREADEGTTAHLFQLLMAGQVPIIVLFAIKWLPRNTKVALQVLALQIAAALVPFAFLFYFEM